MFSSSKCSLFHNSIVFGSCIIHSLYTGCAKTKKNNSGSKRLTTCLSYVGGRCSLWGRNWIRRCIFREKEAVQALYIWRNNRGRSCNCCWSGKKSNEYYLFWVCVCSLGYPTRNAHAPYCHLWLVRMYHIFPHYLINGTVFEKKNTEHKMCVLIFCTSFVWNISHSK